MLLLGMGALSSCKQVAGYAQVHVEDAALGGDGALFDQSSPADGRADGAAGLSPADFPGDGLGDLGGEGRISDAWTPDLPDRDGPTPDAGPPLVACTDGSPPYQRTGWDPSMVICLGAVADQCAAVALCNAATGWQMCTASEYRARGGPGAGWNSFGWIAGCIRSGGQPYAPKDGICDSNCAAKSAQTTDLGYFCDTGAGTWNWGAGAVGLATATSCLRAGVNAAEAEAYWRPRAITLTGDGAVCCR